MKKTTIHTCCYILLTMLLAFTESAQAVPTFKVNKLLQSNMVVQQEKDLKVWGTSTTGNQIIVIGSWGSNDTVITSGAGKWEASIVVPAAIPGSFTAYTITVKDATNTITFSNILIGDVWIASGQSNMAMYMQPFQPYHNGAFNYPEEIPLAQNYPNIRFITVDKDTSSFLQDTIPAGTWQVCDSVSVRLFSVVSYYFARHLLIQRNIPIGMVVSAHGSAGCQAFADRDVLTADPVLKAKYIDTDADTMSYLVRPSMLYNAMIYPLHNLSAKGFIWYQGESNAGPGGRDFYARLCSAMLGGWRNVFNQGNLPFFYVQMPGYNFGGKDPYEFGYAQFREQQEAMLGLTTNTAMSVNIDLTDTTIIHPSKKKEVGERLAFWARRNVYGDTGFVYEGPVYTSLSISHDSVYVNFTASSIGTGLHTFDTMQPKYFFVAGANKKFYPATTAKIVGNKVLLKCTAVQQPVAVRYAFTNFPFANFGNKELLPAKPFRTDNWDTVLMLPLPIINGTHFSKGKIIVSQTGEGFPIVASSATRVMLQEFDTAGVPGFQTILSATDTATRLVQGNGYFNIALSADSSRVLVGGYDAAIGTASVASTPGIYRTVNTVTATGTVTRLSRQASTTFFPSALRSVTGTGTDIWAAGGGTVSTNGGVIYLSGSSRTQVYGTISSTRVASIQNGNLYFSTGTTGSIGIYQVGTGLPQTSAAATLIIATGGSPYGFVFSPNGDTCYVADDRSANSGGGVQKWVRSGGTWSLAYTLNPITVDSATNGVRSIVVDFSGARSIIYATTAEVGANRLIKIVDTGASSKPTVLSKAYTNTYYNSVCFSPNYVPASDTHFSTGNIVVSRTGDGSVIAAGAATNVTLQEYDTMGVPAFSVAIPSTDSTNRLTLSNNFFNLSLSEDRSQIIIGGYNAAINTASVASATGINRVVGHVSINGVYTRPSSITASTLFPSSFRSVAGNAAGDWTAGAGTGTNGGIQFLQGNTRTQVSGTVASTRVVSIVDGQLYFSTGTGVGGQVGIYQVGSGLAQSGSNTATIVVNTTSSGTEEAASPYGFAFSDNGNTCYIADDRTIAKGGGIQKWIKSSGTWSLAYTLSPATSSQTTVGARGLIVDFAGSSPVIYATTAEANANRLIKIVDNGASSTAVALQTAPANTYFNSVCFSPRQFILNRSAVGVFTAIIQQQQVQLQWEIQSQADIQSFDVERYSSTQCWETIATLKTVKTAALYRYFDKQLPAGKSFYRIALNGTNGQKTYSAIRTVSLTPIAAWEAYPNPFSQVLTIRSRATITKPISIRISSADGRQVYRIDRPGPLVQVDTQLWQKGIYSVAYYQEDKLISIDKIIKQ